MAPAMLIDGLVSLLSFGFLDTGFAVDLSLKSLKAGIAARRRHSV